MNRLTIAPTSPKRPARPAAKTRQPQFKKDRPAPPHCLLAPESYESNYAYPLVVWLHSSGGSERELPQVMRLISLRNYASAAVRGPDASQSGYDWPQTSEAIAVAESRVAEAVSRAESRFHIHTQRIFLAGYELGGTMAVRLALRNPERYAGGISLNGAFPATHAPLARLMQLRRSKILIAHCRDSQTYTTDRVCQELALFHAAGLSVTLRQYPCEDELTTQMLSDVDAWLMEQVTGVRSSDVLEPARVESEWN
jgi:phospholipase/carboxylesterase